MYATLTQYHSFVQIESFQDLNYVTSDIKGGLGNQLFMIWTTLSYAHQHHKIAYFEHKKKYMDRSSYWDDFLKELTTMPLIQNDRIYTEPSFNYHSIPKNMNQLNGYFQSYLYFDKEYELWHQLLNIKEKQDRLKEKFKWENTWISVHFRIGDYQHLPHHHPILSKEYYQKAIEWISTQVKNPIFLFFYETSDLEKINQFQFNVPAIHVHEYSLHDWEEMLLMSCCTHHIIANSTFSWWGAYLNPNPNKYVIYPSRWFGPALSHDTSDLCPPEWIKL